MRHLVIAFLLIVVLSVGVVFYLDATFCGIAALGPQVCPGG